MKFQMKLRKTFAVPLMVVAGLGVASAATILSTADVNLKVNELLKPFNNASTQMGFEFTSLNVDAVRALDFGVKGFVYKTGVENEARLEVKTATYAYGDGTKPTADIDAEMKFDLVKFMGQETMNEFADAIDQIVVDAAKDFAADYGAAANVEAKTLDKVVDAKGDVELLKLKLTASIDTSLLPATKTIADVEIQTLEVEVEVSRTTVAFKANVVLNPQYYAFEKDQIGLKEYVEALTSNDQATYDDLNRYLAILDGMATWLVEGKLN